MVKTDCETDGYCGGFTSTQKARAERRAAQVVRVRGREGSRAPAKKDARPELQLRTGASNCGQQMTTDSLAQTPRWQRCGSCAVFVLTLSGIAPAIAANALIGVCEAVGWWIAVLAFFAGCAFACKKVLA